MYFKNLSEGAHKNESIDSCLTKQKKPQEYRKVPKNIPTIILQLVRTFVQKPNLEDYLRTIQSAVRKAPIGMQKSSQSNSVCCVCARTVLSLLKFHTSTGRGFFKCVYLFVLFSPLYRIFHYADVPNNYICFQKYQAKTSHGRFFTGAGCRHIQLRATNMGSTALTSIYM